MDAEDSLFHTTWTCRLTNGEIELQHKTTASELAREIISQSRPCAQPSRVCINICHYGGGTNNNPYLRSTEVDCADYVLPRPWWKNINAMGNLEGAVVCQGCRA